MDEKSEQFEKRLQNSDWMYLALGGQEHRRDKSGVNNWAHKSCFSCTNKQQKVNQILKPLLRV